MNITNQELLDQIAEVSYADAPLWKRFANYVLDLAFIGIGFFAFLFLVGFGTALADPSLPEKLQSDVWLLFLAWVFIYFLGCEGLLKGRTLAKLITQTRAIGQEGASLTGQQLVLRAVCRFIPLDNFSFLFAQGRWHDKLSNTRVVVWPTKNP